VGHEFDFPDGLDYHCSPDPALNTAGQPYGEWTWQLNRHDEWLHAAHLYYETQDDFYAKTVSAWLRNWLMQCPCPAEDHRNGQGPWRTIEIGIRMGRTWPQILSAFIDNSAFDNTLLLSWLQCYAEQAAFVYQYRKRNNWLLMEMNGLMHAGIQVWMHKDARKWRQQATDVLIAETREQFHPDGMQRELSTSYHIVCFSNYLWTVQILHHAGFEVDPRLEDCLKNTLKPLRALACGDGYLFNFQDSKAGRIQSVLQRCPPEWLRDSDQWFLGDGDHPPEQTCHLLANSGYAVLRSGYQAGDTAVAFDGGPFGDGHQHEDKLSIQVYAGGTLLLGDAGIVDYNDSPERFYSLETFAHNTAVVDGWGQNRRTGYYRSPRPKIEESPDLICDLHAAQPWVSAEYAEGYGPEQKHCVRHKRTVTMRSPNLIEVRDEFSSRDHQPHDIEILFHFLTETAKLDQNSRRCSASKKGTDISIAWHCDHAEVKASVVCGGDDPDLRGWAEPDSSEDGLLIVVPRPCLTLKANVQDSLIVTSNIHISTPQA
jgi:hypothetical protein